MRGVYDSDRKLRVTEVDGSSFTGLYASDGSYNVVIDDTSSTGVYHPCGAYRVSSTETTKMYDPSGALSLLIWAKIES